jgi:hypothetical protein
MSNMNAPAADIVEPSDSLSDDEAADFPTPVPRRGRSPRVGLDDLDRAIVAAVAPGSTVIVRAIARIIGASPQLVSARVGRLIAIGAWPHARPRARQDGNAPREGLDDVDGAIVRLAGESVSAHGRWGPRVIAPAVGLTEGGVRARVRRLITLGAWPHGPAERPGLLAKPGWRLSDDQRRLAAERFGLVWIIARDYLHMGLPYDDLVGCGSVGLVYAAYRFDPTRGVAFGTYAGHWIKAMIRRGLGRASLVAVPTDLSDTASTGVIHLGDWATELVDHRSPGVEDIAQDRSITSCHLENGDYC